MKSLAEAHSALRDHARRSVRASDALSVPERSPWRRRSIADRVHLQVALIEEAARKRRRMNMQLGMAAASLTLITLLFSSPTPARQWFYRQLTAALPASQARQFPKPMPFGNHDPFEPQLNTSWSSHGKGNPSEYQYENSVARSVPPPPPASLGTSEALPSIEVQPTTNMVNQPANGASTTDPAASSFTGSPPVSPADNQNPASPPAATVASGSDASGQDATAKVAPLVVGSAVAQQISEAKTAVNKKAKPHASLAITTAYRHDSSH